MRIAIMAVGKVRQPGLRPEIDEYLRRIRRYARCDEIELKDGPEAEVSARFQRAISGRTSGRTKSVALEVEGVAWNSQEFARFVGKCERDSVGTLALLIGGAYGLPRQISQAADLRLSLTKMTLPHRLVRLVLAEQVYRAFTILRNEPYAH